MIVSITGHRPEDLPNADWVKQALQETLQKVEATQLIQGMAAGADLLSAEAAIEIGIPVISARPWSTHTPRVEDKELYNRVLEQSEEVVIVSDAKTYTGPHLYHIRNEYMVNRAEIVIAIWTGKTSGGTYACITYAKKRNKQIIVINPNKKTITPHDEPTLF